MGRRGATFHGMELGSRAGRALKLGPVAAHCSSVQGCSETRTAVSGAENVSARVRAEKRGPLSSSRRRSVTRAFPQLEPPFAPSLFQHHDRGPSSSSSPSLPIARPGPSTVICTPFIKFHGQRKTGLDPLGAPWRPVPSANARPADGNLASGRRRLADPPDLAQPEAAGCRSDPSACFRAPRDVGERGWAAGASDRLIAIMGQPASQLPGERTLPDAPQPQANPRLVVEPFGPMSRRALFCRRPAVAVARLSLLL